MPLPAMNPEGMASKGIERIATHPEMTPV